METQKNNSVPFDIEICQSSVVSDQQVSSSCRKNHSQSQTNPQYLSGIDNQSTLCHRTNQIPTYTSRQQLESTVEKDLNFQKLEQLKKQYQWLRNSQVEESLVYQGSEQENSDQSQKSNGKYSRKSHRILSTHRHKTMKLLQFENKQLEIILANTMSKMEELLKSQVEYKRIIHALINNDPSKVEKFNSQRQKVSYSSQSHLICSHNRQLEELRDLKDELILKIGGLQEKLKDKDGEIRKLSEENMRINDQLYLNKEKQLIHEIQIKRIKMEYQMLEKQKTAEINRLMRVTYDSRVASQTTPNLDLIRNIQQQIRSHSSMYEQAIRQSVSIRKMKDFASPNIASILKQLSTKLALDPSNEISSSLIQSIGEYLNNHIAYTTQIQLKMENLQKGMEQQGKLMKAQYDRNERYSSQKKDELELQLKNLKYQYKKDVCCLEDTVRNTRRQLDDTQFRIQKLIKQNQFNQQLAKSKLTAETDLMNTEIARLTKQRDQWKRQFNNMKEFYEKKIQRIQNSIKEHSSQINRQLTEQNQQLQKLRRNNFDIFRQKEYDALLARLQELTSTNEHLCQQNMKLIQGESEVNQLKVKNKQRLKLNQTIQHLWSIKEVQYNNINEFFQELRP